MIQILGFLEKEGKAISECPDEEPNEWIVWLASSWEMICVPDE